MSRLVRPDAEIAYETGGEGSELVTFLHGFTQRGRSWNEVIDLLGRGRRWLVVDLRGHGETREAEGAPVTMSACAQDLLAVWDELGVPRSHVVGYSMGARLALHVAVNAAERVRGLAAVAPHAGLRAAAERAQRRAHDDDLADRIESNGIEWFADYWSALPIFSGLARRGPEYVEAIRRGRLLNRPEGLAASLRGMGLGAMDELWSGLPKVVAPALMVAGERDNRAAVTAELAEATPGAELALFEDTGHCVHMERPAKFAARLAGFLDAVDGGQTAVR